MNKNWIVVWDPVNEWWPGSLIDGDRARQLEARGVASLPVRPELFRSSGVGGYCKREWGAGWPLDYLVPKFSCPLTMFCTREFSALHWCMRLTADEKWLDRARAGEKFEGQLRMAMDSNQVTTLTGGLVTEQKPIDARELGPPDQWSGWTARGRANMQAGSPGHYAFGLYGAAPGLRVVWIALSLAA